MSENLVIACVKWGKAFPAAWANILYDMVQRNLPNTAFDFFCFTDDATGLHPNISVRELPRNLTGWWNKLYLFKEGTFSAHQRIIYFDLDTLIIGKLDDIVKYQGDFALLRDFYRPGGYGSGVMMWPGGTNHHIWSEYEKAGRPNLPGGDQIWLEKICPGADLLQNLFPNRFASYKVNCHPLPPENASVVCFHGEPKQDNANEHWVADVWQVGGIFNPALGYLSADEEKIVNIRHAISLPYPWLKAKPSHGKTAAIIGGGPALNKHVEEIRQRSKGGDTIFAVNNSAAWLEQHNTGFDGHILSTMDFEPVNLPGTTSYCSSACSPAVFEKTSAGNIIIWHPEISGIAELIRLELQNEKTPQEFIKGGTTGLMAIWLVYTLGYRMISLYGFDSCLDVNGAHHAYPQRRNDNDRVIETESGGRRFYAAPWMLNQAREFVSVARELASKGCKITVHGEGLIHYIAGLL